MHDHLVDLLHATATTANMRHGQIYNRARWDGDLRAWTDEQLIATIGIVAESAGLGAC